MKRTSSAARFARLGLPAHIGRAAVGAGQQHSRHVRPDLQARLERQQPISGLERKHRLAARQVQLGLQEEDQVGVRRQVSLGIEVDARVSCTMASALAYSGAVAPASVR